MPRQLANCKRRVRLSQALYLPPRVSRLAVAPGRKIERNPGDLGRLVAHFRRQSDFLLGGGPSILLRYGTVRFVLQGFFSEPTENAEGRYAPFQNGAQAGFALHALLYHRAHLMASRASTARVFGFKIANSAFVQNAQRRCRAGSDKRPVLFDRAGTKQYTTTSMFSNVFGAK